MGDELCMGDEHVLKTLISGHQVIEFEQLGSLKKPERKYDKVESFVSRYSLLRTLVLLAALKYKPTNLTLRFSAQAEESELWILKLQGRDTAFA